EKRAPGIQARRYRTFAPHPDCRFSDQYAPPLRWAGAWELTRVSPPAQQGHGEGESKAGILPRIGVEGSRITFYAASEIASSLSFSSAKTAFRVRATSM